MYCLFQSSDIRTLDKVQKLEHETKTDTIPKKDKIKNISKYPFQHTRSNETLKKKQIFQSEDESQQIAVWWLLYYVQHPDQYLGRLRTIWHLRITPRRFGLRAGDAQSRRPLGCSESNRPRRQSSLPRTRQMYAPAKLAHRCARCERYRCSDQTGF